jgi:hypothetical protein
VRVDQDYAAARVTRETAPEQVCNFLEVCGEARDPAISFCAAGGSYGVLHAYCDLMGIPYSAADVVGVFKAQIPIIEQHWIKISASCEEVRQWAIANGKWIPVNRTAGVVFKPGWVALLNYEDKTELAHHYATVVSGSDREGLARTIEFNTSLGSGSDAHGGAVAPKVRFLRAAAFRGFVRTW